MSETFSPLDVEKIYCSGPYLIVSIRDNKEKCYIEKLIKEGEVTKIEGRWAEAEQRLFEELPLQLLDYYWETNDLNRLELLKNIK